MLMAVIGLKKVEVMADEKAAWQTSVDALNIFLKKDGQKIKLFITVTFCWSWLNIKPCLLFIPLKRVADVTSRFKNEIDSNYYQSDSTNWPFRNFKTRGVCN